MNASVLYLFTPVLSIAPKLIPTIAIWASAYLDIEHLPSSVLLSSQHRHCHRHHHRIRCRPVMPRAIDLNLVKTE